MAQTNSSLQRCEPIFLRLPPPALILILHPFPRARQPLPDQEPRRTRRRPLLRLPLPGHRR
jgi:hypothetical protein